MRSTAANFALDQKKARAAQEASKPTATTKDLLRKFPFDPLMDPKATRHDDLKGDKGLMYFLNPRDGSYTHYTGYFAGK